MAISFRNRDIVSITDSSREEILHLCEAGRRMYERKKSGGRYCRRPYSITSPKVEPADLAAYVATLPGAIEPAQ